MNEITMKVDESASITDDLEICVHAINESNGKCILLITEHGEDTMSVVEQGDTVVFHSHPCHIMVGRIAGQRITMGLGDTTVH